jgi:hypothetical protein
MRIGVLGTGMVGRAIAGKLSELGHEVVVGTRDPGGTLARQEQDLYGNPPFPACSPRGWAGGTWSTWATSPPPAGPRWSCRCGCGRWAASGRRCSTTRSSADR